MSDDTIIDVPTESMDACTNVEETPKKKSFKIPALIIGVCMIVAGGIGIALMIPNFF